MGIWDKDVDNSLDRMFDFNRDGKLDISEQSMQFDFLDRMTRDDEDYDDEDDYEDFDYEDEEYDDEF